VKRNRQKKKSFGRAGAERDLKTNLRVPLFFLGERGGLAGRTGGFTGRREGVPDF